MECQISTALEPLLSAFRTFFITENGIGQNKRSLTMRLIPLTTEQQVSRWAARHIVNRINHVKPTAERPCV